MDIASGVLYVTLFIALYFEVFLLISFFEGLRAGKAPKPTFAYNELPTATVITPAYNEERTICMTIESLLALDYPPEKLSIFVVDDGSKDNTWKVLEHYKDNPRVRLFRKENGGKHTALNYALKHVSSELVGCLDADTFVAKDALQEIVQPFAQKDVMAVIPTIKVNHPRNFIEFIQNAEYTISAFIRTTFGNLNAIFITPGPFSFFRYRVFKELGEYRPAYHTEDMEIALRLQKHHYKIAHAHNAHVFTNAPRTYRTLFRQRVRWSYGFIKNAAEYRSMFLNPKYGDLGIFILPFGLFTIVPAIYFSGFLLFNIARQLIMQFFKFQALGWHFPYFSFGFSWFYFNTSTIILLSSILALVMMTTMVIGRGLASERRRFGIDIPLYIISYGILAPWWLGFAVYRALLSREASWTQEIDRRRLIEKSH